MANWPPEPGHNVVEQACFLHFAHRPQVYAMPDMQERRVTSTPYLIRSGFPSASLCRRSSAVEDFLGCSLQRREMLKDIRHDETHVLIRDSRARRGNTITRRKLERDKPGVSSESGVCRKRGLHEIP